MALSFLPLLVDAETLFIKAPGLEEAEEVLYPGEQSFTAVVDGTLDQFEKNKIKMGSERSFGLTFFGVFLIVTTLPLLSGEPPRLWAFAIALIFVAFALIRPTVLAPLNRLWFQFGLLL